MTVDMISNLISTNPRSLSLGSTLVAALVLAGCTSLAPRHERPAAPVPAELPLPASLAASAPASAASTAWPDFLRSAPLQQLVKLSLERNRDLRLAVLNVQRAQAQLGVTRADRLPTVGVGLTQSATPSGGSTARSYTAGLQVSGWEVDLFGRLANLGEAAQAQVLASEAGRRSAELALVAGVASSWLTLAADTDLLASTSRLVESREASMKLAQLRFDKGAASSLELQSARTLLEQARAARAQLQRQRDQDLNALTLLAGGPVPAELLPTASTSAMAGDTLAPVPVGLSSQVLLQRPDVIEAEQQLVAANANIGVARAAFFPRLTLTASAGQASTSLSDLFNAGQFAWTMSSQLLATVFDAGRNKANLEGAKIARDIAVTQYEKAVQSAFRDTADALAGLDTWRDQLAAQQTQLDAIRETARLTDLRYQNGAASELERLDAQRSLLSAEQALVQVRLGEQLNRVALWKVLGG
ncbi:efflux transporter outer membrane subunit [Sphaerotilus natans]|uniref:efflux transporter outer membrane subunit n=1 Tax=Sphaerotilus natans TaxID=34103 RepID=UPI00406CF0F6